MTESLSPAFWQSLLRPEALFFVLCILMGGISIICGTWSKVSRHNADTDLKRDMVARGMSAEEIERVLAAKSKEK